MHDVIVMYHSIPDREAFAAHYAGEHQPLVLAMPELQEFVWGFVTEPGEGDPKLIARMTYVSREVADRSFASNAGKACVRPGSKPRPPCVRIRGRPHRSGLSRI